MSRLRSGEVLHEFTQRNASGGTIRVQILMHSTAEDVWDILTGCEKYFVFVDGLELCDILEQSPEYMLIHQVTDLGFFVPTQDFVYESRRVPFTRMDFKLVEGNLKIMQGYWEFKTVEEGVLVVFNMHVRANFPVPRWLVRRSLGKSVPEMLACMRGLVDGSGSPEQINSDLKRCPGDV